MESTHPPLPTYAVVRATLEARGEQPNQSQIASILECTGRFDDAIARLKAAGDHLLGDFQARKEQLPAEQQEAFERVLGRVVEHTDTLMLVRDAVLTVVLSVGDADIDALLALAGAVSGQVLQAAANH